MKKLKRGVIALLAGEFLVMWKKDNTFKKQLKKKEGRDRFKFVAEKLFAFNKDLFEEGRQVIESTDMKAEYEALKHKVIDTKDSLEGMTQKKREEILADIHGQYDRLALRAKQLDSELDEKYGWKEKRKELKAMINKLNK